MSSQSQHKDGASNNFQKSFTNKVQKILSYLEKEWSEQIASDFLSKIHQRITLLKKNPDIGMSSKKVSGVGGILIKPHNRLYYKLSKDTIIVLNLYDTRMNPEKNPY